MTASEAERVRFGSHGRLSRRSIAVGVVGIAALALLARFTAAILVNAPAGPSALPVGALDRLAAGLAALAAVGLGVTEDDPVAGVGLLFVGVFGCLAVGVGLAVPAGIAVVAGTAVVLVAATERLSAATVPAVGLVVALAVSLLAGLGVAQLGHLGSALALLAIGTTPLFAATDRRALAGGVIAFAVVIAAGLAYPFVTGAVTLVASGVVGASLPVIGLAVAGAVTTASAALRQRRWALLAGVGLLALAGVPATLSRGIPFALGIATVLTLGVGK